MIEPLRPSNVSKVEWVYKEEGGKNFDYGIKKEIILVYDSSGADALDGICWSMLS